LWQVSCFLPFESNHHRATSKRCDLAQKEFVAKEVFQGSPDERSPENKAWWGESAYWLAGSVSLPIFGFEFHLVTDPMW